MKKIGLYSFFIGILMIIFYGLTMFFKDAEIALWAKLAMTLILGGIVMILVNQLMDRNKEKEEEDDSSKY